MSPATLLKFDIDGVMPSIVPSTMALEYELTDEDRVPLCVGSHWCLPNYSLNKVEHDITREERTVVALNAIASSASVGECIPYSFNLFYLS